MSPLTSSLPAAIEVQSGPAMSVSTREWVAEVASRLTAAQACAVVEHRFGVLPLMSYFDGYRAAPGCSHEAMAAVASETTLGALGLFTPNPECAWIGAPLTGEWLAGARALIVRGEVRLPHQAVDGAIVPVRVSEADLRLVWLDLRSAGVDRRESRSNVLIDGASIEPAAISRPITRAPGGELYRQLYAYAGVWALAAIHIAKRIVLALRRAARTTHSDSQLIAMSLAEVEIETDLVAVAAGKAESAAGPMLALSAARALASAAETARLLNQQLGLPLDGWLAGASEPALTMYLGGTPMLEHELARALDIGGSAAGDRR